MFIGHLSASLPRSHFQEAPLVILVIRSHEPVPVVEIEPKVPAHALVVHGMIGRRVHDESKRRSHQPSRMEFIPGVADHVEQHLPGQEDPERVRMHGHDGDSDREDSGLNNSLRWAEGEGGPWGGIGREMMRPMKESEQLGMMHQAMRPVEPSIVQ